jgi:hypothetical protein
VWERDREYTLRGSESRTLAAVGAFRVVSSRDLRDKHDRRSIRGPATCDTCASNGSIARVPGSREHAIALTKEGRSLLEHHRDRPG